MRGIETRIQRLEAVLLPPTLPGATLADWLAYHGGTLSPEQYTAKLTAGQVDRMQGMIALVALALADFEDEL